jgi:hypothetical protein
VQVVGASDLESFAKPWWQTTFPECPPHQHSS